MGDKVEMKYVYPLVCRVFGHRIIIFESAFITSPEPNAFCSRCGVSFIIGRIPKKKTITPFEKTLKSILIEARKKK